MGFRLFSTHENLQQRSFRNVYWAGLIASAVGGCSLAVGDLPEPTGQAGAGGNHDDVKDSGEMADGSTSNAGTTADDTADATAPHTRIDSGFNPCDRDGDGELNEDCGGNDCDDDDDAVFPGQERYFGEATAKDSFDYDCTGSAEREYPQRLDCSAEPLCDMTKQGFMNDPLPLCGQQGLWGHCVEQQLPGLLCEAQADTMQRVACH